MTQHVLFASTIITPSLEERQKQTMKGRDLILMRKYQEAEKFFLQMVTSEPNFIEGYFGCMALYQMRNMENFDHRYDSLYSNWEDKSHSRALQILQDPQASEWDLLIAGGILGLAGFHRAHNDQFFSAVREAGKAMQVFRRASELNPNSVESILGVGNYTYWKSHFMRRLKFLPFIRDQRKEAKVQLNAATHAAFTGPFVEGSLAFIAFKEKNFPEALEKVQKLLKKYPPNLILRLLRGQIHLELKNYTDALSDFDTTLREAPALTKTYLYKGLVYVEMKDSHAASENILKFLELEPKLKPYWQDMALTGLQKVKEKK